MNPLVSPEWLANRLSHPNTVIVDATLPLAGAKPPLDARRRYAEAHIPGSIFFDIEEISDHSTALPHMLPPPDIFSHMMSSLGISNSMTIVVYEQDEVYSAPRAWWTLRTFGAKEVYLLDGGLNAWRAAGFAVDSGIVSRAPAHFQAELQPAAVRSFFDIQRLIQGRGQSGQDGQILDARAAQRFEGRAPEPRPGIASGHMPGSINVPFTELLERGRLKSPEALRELFAARGVNLSAPLTTTCGSGVTAAVLNLGLQLAGAKDISLYDGSWAEYAQQPEAAIEGSSS